MQNLLPEIKNISKKNITLKDIANRLNLSVVTVSKALKNHPDISLKTKNLITQTAESLEYFPNLIARNFASKKTNTIGVVVPKIAHHFFGTIMESIYDLAFEYNYDIILMISQENQELEKKHISTLISMKVDGIIISISSETQDYNLFKEIRNKKIPIVFFDRIPKMKRINKVYVDDKGGSFQAIDHAIKVGYKKIGHFAGPSDSNIASQRYTGFKEAMNKNGIPINQDWVIHGGFDEKHGYDSFIKLYNDNNLPELIFTVTYPVAIGVYDAVTQLGLNIPNDIDIICFGNAVEQDYLSPSLSSVGQSPHLMAKNAMNILISNINDPEKHIVESVKIPTGVILRETCSRKKRIRV